MNPTHGFLWGRSPDLRPDAPVGLLAVPKWVVTEAKPVWGPAAGRGSAPPGFPCEVKIMWHRAGFQPARKLWDRGGCEWLRNR